MSTEQGVRSWMTRRTGESVRAYHFRVAHTCYRCGWFCADMAALDAHEARRDCPQKA